MGRTSLDERQGAAIAKALERGATTKALALQYDVSQRLIRVYLPASRKRKWQPNRLELIGQTFGEWKVLAYAEPPPGTTNTTKCRFFLCECSCGLRKEVRGAHLTAGETTRCRECHDRRRPRTKT